MIAKNDVKVGQEVYHVFEEDMITKVRITAVGPTGCCIEPVDESINFAIDTATYGELHEYPFTVYYSPGRQEMWVRSLVTPHNFALPEDEALDLMKLSPAERYRIIALDYSSEIEDIL